MRPLVVSVSLLVLFAALLTGAGARAQEGSPAASPVALPPLLAEWTAAFNSGDADQLLALYTNDAVWEEVAIGLYARGQGEIRAHLERLFAAVPDFTVEVTSGIMAGDRAMVEWVISGTYGQDFPGLPPATGQHFSFRGASVFALADGKIRHYTEYWDAYEFLVQLGALPVPEAAATPVP